MGRKRRKNRRKKKKKKEKTVAGCNKTPNAGGTVKFLTKADDWEVELDIVKECSKISDNGAAIVWIEPLAKVKIDALMGEYKSQEWLAYLLGNKEERTVKDIFVPEQKATSVRVDDIECETFNDLPVIGVIHSHHGMGTGFSGTDNEYINQNHDISLVVAHTGVAGQVRAKVPCGAMMISEAKVKIKLDIDGFDKGKFLEKAKANIKEKTFIYQRPSYQNWRQSPQNPQRPPGAAGQSGYWFMGKWHEADPIKSDEEIEAEIDRIHTSVDTSASYWVCKSCGIQNYTKDSTKCWKCDKDITTPRNNAWVCKNCKGVNQMVNATSCMYCSIPRRPLTLAEKNQREIDKMWGDDSKPSKHIGNYICGRCDGTWENVDLRRFTECPNCDITLEDELRKDLDKAEKKSTDADTVASNMKTTSAGSNVAGSPKDPHSCRVCGRHTSVPHSVHMQCFERERKEKRKNNTVWNSQSEPVV